MPTDRALLPGRTTRLAHRLAPLGVVLLGQAVAVGVVARVAHARGRGLLDVLTSWDGQHFVAIADEGYSASVEAGVQRSPAFFPGLPLLMRALSGVTGLPLEASGLVVSVVSTAVLAHGLVALMTALADRGWAGGGRPTGLVLVGLVSTGPLSVVLAMVYTEALFCALAAWCLVHVVRERWLSAGLIALVAGLVRPTAAALVGVVALAALAAVVRELRATGRLGASSVRAVVATAVAPLGALGYLAWVTALVGRPSAWFEAQANGWGTRFDLGAGTLRFIARSLVTAPALLDVVVVAAVAASLVLLLLQLRQQQPLVLVAYSALVMVTVLGADGVMNSKVRLLVPAFTLLVPLAVWLRRQHPHVALLAGACYALAGTWYSAYGMVIYGFAP